MIELSEGGGAVLYSRIIDGDRLAFSGRRHKAGRGRIGLDGTPEGQGEGIATAMFGGG